jgi:hypothetical protein
MIVVAWTLAVIMATQAGSPATAAQPTLRGTIVDAKTSAPIKDARVTLVEASLDVRTAADGRFEFPHLQPKTYTLTVSTIGYIFVRRRVEVGANLTIDLTIPLAEGTGTYQEQVTVASDAAAQTKAVGVSSQMQLGSAGLQDLRGVAADDPMRAVQALPGVATGDDFQASFSVRGSAFRQVGVVMDGTPTQLLLHAIHGVDDGGSVAMINSDILSGATLFAGPHARQHGDWLGATLDFDVREGSRDRLGARAAVSGTSASGVFEGPIGSTHRGSWLVSVRKSYLDWLVRQIEPGVSSAIGFTDGQAKLVFDLTPSQQLQFLTVAGDAEYQDPEATSSNDLKTANSRSVLASASWRLLHPWAVFNQRVSFVANDFVNHGAVGQRLAEGHTTQVIWRGDIVRALGRGWTLEGGARYEHLDLTDTARKFAATGASSVRVTAERTGSASPATTAGWGQVSWSRAKTAFTAGLRATDRTTVAHAVLPWALAEHTMGSTTIRASAGRSAQFLDPLIVTVAPVDPVPETAEAYDASVDQPIGHGIRIQATGFYRTESDVLRRAGENRVDPVTGKRIVESVFPVFSPTLTGTSRGIDLLVMRQSATGFSGWLGYTWAHTRYHDELTGEDFDGDFDQRHTLNIFAQQRLSYRMTVSAKFRVGSNFPLVGYFSGTTDPDALKLSTLRNQVRLPVYARLDVRANRTFTFQRSRLTLFVEVMNLLNRDNLRQVDGSIRSNLDAVGFVDRLLPRVPSAGLLFEF